MTEVVRCLRAAAPEALAGLPAVFAYLYGSQATGQARADSDVDVAVMLEHDVPSAQRLSVASRCADALSAATELGGIEVTVLNDAALRFAGRVLRQRVVVFSRDEPRRVAYESLVGRMADDVEVWAAQMDAEILDAIAEGRR